MPQTRDEHLAWCKERALAYLPANPQLALDSIQSDLTKHEQTRDHAAIKLTMSMRVAKHLETAEDVRRWIEGFN